MSLCFKSEKKKNWSKSVGLQEPSVRLIEIFHNSLNMCHQYHFSSVGYLNEVQCKMPLVLIGALNGPSVATVAEAALSKQQSKS
jgi:hypothetical protein